MTLAPWWPLGRVVPHKLRIFPPGTNQPPTLFHSDAAVHYPLVLFPVLYPVHYPALLFLLVDCTRRVEALTGGVLPLRGVKSIA